MDESAEQSSTNAHTPTRLTMSLSGGGYRATMFAAGAMLAVADSALRTGVASISSVSGGSITSAATLGGFQDPTEHDPDPMGRRVARLASLTQSAAIPTERVLNRAKIAFISLAIPFFYLLLNPLGTRPVVSDADPNPPRAAEDFLEFLRNSDTLLAQLNWIAIVVPAILLISFPVVAALFAATAIIQSWYAVQSVVETIAADARDVRQSPEGTKLRDVDIELEPRRIFCATDLSAGGHVYFTSHRVVAPGEEGRDPNVYLADVAAASACFPGFRPLVFRRAELGLNGSPIAGLRPRRHTNLKRLLIGMLGWAGVFVGVGALAMRVFGALPGWVGLVGSLVCATVGTLAAFGSVGLLRSSDDLVLVDGGVCDNLGAAFTLLSKDDRYSELPRIAGSDKAGLMLVIDASKPFTAMARNGTGLGDLIPLRIRGAQRSMVQLLGNANAAARKHVIEVALNSSGPVTGAIVSISAVPEPITDAAARWENDRKIDSVDLVDVTSKTPTTLDALPPSTVLSLVLQGYRLTQSALTKHGVHLTRIRTVRDIVNDVFLSPGSSSLARKYFDAFPSVDPKIAGRLRKSPDPRGKGPYARRSRFISWVARGVHVTVLGTVATAIVISYMAFAVV